MLHQSLPLYEGNQPFIYAFYCAEDDDIAFPVLARMYNEGFRIWCAGAGGVSNNFRNVQRMNASASVMLFISRNMLEMLRTGSAEVVAAAKNPRLHFTVSLDGTKADKSLWALAVPEEMEYNPGNDAGFWLQMYTSDKLEKCRGPWPEKKISYRESNFDFLPERAVKAEYDKLERIMSGNNAVLSDAAKSSEPVNGGRAANERDSDNGRYKNNVGYIAPQPDDYVYIPLDRLEVTKSEEEKEFDAFIGYIDRCVMAEERSAADKEADDKYLDAARNQKAEAAADGPHDTVNFADADAASESTLDNIEYNEPKKNISKADRVVSVDTAMTQALNPEARRRRMYENGSLDKVLDPNDIDALVQRRKKEEREKAEEAMNENKMSAQEETASVNGAKTDNDNAPADVEINNVETATEEIIAESISETDSVNKNDVNVIRAEESMESDLMLSISEESLSGLIDSTDMPSLPDEILSPEQLAAAPTYIIVPSGSSSEDVPQCLKLVETDGGVIAVPTPLPQEDTFSFALSGSEEKTDEMPIFEEKKRHAIARKVSRRREAVKVTPIKCETIRTPLGQDSLMFSQNRQSKSEQGDGVLESNMAESVVGGTNNRGAKSISAADEEVLVTTMRKFRNRPAAVSEETEPETQAVSEYSSDTSENNVASDEAKSTHRKNKYPHSQSGLLANVISMLSREYERTELAEISDEADKLYGIKDSAISEIASNGFETEKIRQKHSSVVSSLTAAVEKFVEVAPLEPVMVVPRRK